MLSHLKCGSIPAGDLGHLEGRPLFPFDQSVHVGVHLSSSTFRQGIHRLQTVSHLGECPMCELNVIKLVM